MAEKAIKNKDSIESQELKTFNPGDLAVYPAHGVGMIESIESREIGGEKMNFYIMKIIENNMVIMIPTKNVSSVGLRNVIKKNDIKKVYEVIQKNNNNSLENQTWNRRHREYMEKIKTGSLYDVAEVFRDLFVLKFSKDLSFGERKLFDTAQGLLLKELCISTGKDENNILSEIEALFETKQE